MTSKARVVVGITTHNRSDILAKAIDSALSQSYPAVCVEVADDASTDATPGIRPRYPQVRWRRWDDNQGCIRARNHLMLEAQEDYYVSLDDDAWFLDGDEIEIAIALLESDQSVSAIAFDILSPDRPTRAARVPAVPTAMFIGCGHVLRLATVRALNGYSPFPGSYGAEEKDFCLRLIDSGHRVLKLPGVHVWHDKVETARDRASQYRSSVCNDLAMAVRRTPASALPFAIVWKLLKHLEFSIRIGMVPAYFGGLKALACSLPSVWRGRRPVRLSTLREFGRLSKKIPGS